MQITWFSQTVLLSLSLCVLILLVQSIFVGANFSVPVQVRACVWWVLIPEGVVWACCPAAGGGPHLRQEWWVICGVSEVGNLKPLLYCMALLTGTVSLSGCDWTVGQKPKTLATLCGVAYRDWFLMWMWLDGGVSYGLSKVYSHSCKHGQK